MNFGILLVQRLVDSFGPVTMAAFAAAVKIDSFRISAGAGFRQRVFHLRRAELRRGAAAADPEGLPGRNAGLGGVLGAHLLVCVFAQPLMRIFVQAGEVEVLAAGVRYLRIEGACYVGIGCLFCSTGSTAQ